MLPPKTSLWAMQPEYFESMRSILPAKLREWPAQSQVEAAREAAGKQLRRVSGNVAVLPLYGIVEQRMSGYGFMFGSVSTEQVGRAVDALLASPDVSAIVLDWDSPGGTIYGTQELSDKLFASRGAKPIVSVVNSLMASAAFWIGTAADQVVMSPGADTASVGVYSMHVDYSAALEAEGVKVTFVKAGKYKAEGNPYQPLSAEAGDYLQQSVDETYTAFIKALARNRKTSQKDVRDNYGQGRTMGAEAAKAAGLVDLIGTLEDVVGRLTGSASSAKAASVEVLRLRQEHRKAMGDFKQIA